MPVGTDAGEHHERYGARMWEKDGEAVQSYLRRVSWIEQQKKLQLGLGAATGTRHRSEQPWMSMTDAMRVQKEMQRMRLNESGFTVRINQQRGETEKGKTSGRWIGVCT
ncbi:hypothetical protein TcBrA4_0101430 [Trypanosoma cruzi]|nr:hypothetical protein TcBrA4_0101430 [Trypanosoma cruzi]